MKISVQDARRATAVVALDGDLTQDGREALRHAVADLVAGRCRALVFDMSGVRFIDGQGLELLLWVRDICQSSRVPFRMAGLDETCSTILRMTRLDKEWSCSAHVDDAVQSLV
ncbi:MAG: STAS domain-containing protein [Phycisphaerae bacterium]|nr:STAS domain-containing protein [Phycisphaerae bacterium]